MLRNVEGRFEDVSTAVGVGATWARAPARARRGRSRRRQRRRSARRRRHDRAGGPSQRRRQRQQRRPHRAARPQRQPQRHRHESRGAGRHGVAEVRDRLSASGFLGQGSPEILAGIGKATQADVVRLLWPTGVVQDEVELKANTRHAITQIDRRGSSCPVLFSWNGERYEFVADAIGPAVVGHWVAPDTRNISDVDELVKVEGPPGAREGRPRVVPLRRADGGSDLPRSGEAVRDRSPRRHRRLPQRVLRRDAAAPGRSSDRLARRAGCRWARGTARGAT